MAKSRRNEKQELNKEVERSIQEEQDIQAAIRDCGYFYDEEWYTYQEYLAKQEEEIRQQEIADAQLLYNENDYLNDEFWGDDYEDSHWDGV